MIEELKMRVPIVLSFLTKALDKNRVNNNKPLSTLVMEATMYLSEFNFYPSGNNGTCCNVVFFTSLIGNRWNLEVNEKLTFDQMFSYLIKHCQGGCANITKYAVVLIDNWNDDTVEYWKDNVEQIKKHGIVIEVHLVTGQSTNRFFL